MVSSGWKWYGGGVTNNGGTWTVAASNSYAGNTVINGGAYRISSPLSLGNQPGTWTPDRVILNGGGLEVSDNTSVTLIRNNNSGFSTLQFDGSLSNLTLAQPITISCRNTPNFCLQNLAGSNVLTGGISIQVGGADQWWQSDAGTLALAGDINYAGALAGGPNHHFQGPGNFLVTANINASPIGSPIAITKDGSGTLNLAGVNTYGTTTAITNGVLLLTGSITHTGAVTVAGGTLAGTGSISAGAGVIVLAGGTIAPGVAGIGTLTINNDLTLAGNTAMEVNKFNGQHDQFVGLGTVNYGGTLSVTNLADTPGPGLAWSFNPANGVVSVVTGIANYPTNLTATVNGNTLTLAWPSTHLGWLLQSQTNGLSTGLNTNWVDVTGTAGVTSTNLTLDALNPSVFFRLRSP